MDDFSSRLTDLPPERRALLLSLREEQYASAQITPIPRRQQTGLCPVSFVQQRFWFLDQLSPGNTTYNNPAIGLHLTGELNISALQRSLDEIIDRHEILRTTFTTVDGKLFQTIAPARPLSLPLLDMEMLPVAERIDEALRQITTAFDSVFNLSQGPLMKACLVRLNTQEHLFFLLMHHSITDHSSNTLLIRELSLLYSAFVANEPASLPELPIQYADFAIWQREQLAGEKLERLLAYWGSQLSGALPSLELPTSSPHRGITHFQGATHSFRISSELLTRLRGLSQRVGATLYMTLLAAFKAILYGYTRQEDILVGTLVSNRDRLELENLLGAFVNNLVLRTDLSGNPSFLDLLRRVREVALAAYDHRDMPFEKLVEFLRPERASGLTPLVQIAFSYVVQANALQTGEFSGLSLTHLVFPESMADLDMLFSATEETDGLNITIQYRKDLFAANLVAQIADHYATALGAVAVDPEERLDDLTKGIRQTLPNIQSNREITSGLVDAQGSQNASNLTKSQLLFWMGQKMQPDVPLYNSICTFTIFKALDPGYFIEAFDILARRTDALRTIFEEINGIPQQRVLPYITYHMEYQDLSHENDPLAALRTLIRERGVKCFTLEKSLFDPVLIKLGDKKFVWYAAHHHLITDKWSTVVMCRRLLEIYENLVHGLSWDENGVYPQFAEYIRYEQAYRNSKLGTEAEMYWQKKLAEAQKPLKFYGRIPLKRTTLIDRVPWSFGIERTSRLKSLAIRPDYSVVTSDLSLFSVFATVLFAYLYRISDSQCISIGVPLQTRQEAFRETIGLFMEACPLRVVIAEDETFSSLFQKVKAELLESLQQYPRATPNPSNTVYDVLLNYHPHIAFPDQIHYEWHHAGHGNDSLNVQIDGIDEAGSFRLLFDFHRDVFNEEQYPLVIQHFLGFFDAFLENDGEQLSRVEFLTAEERQQLIARSKGKVVSTETAPVHYQFEQQVIRTPEAIALVCGDQQLTYSCLNSRANQLAHSLQRLGVGVDTKVGICIERSLATIIGVLGILKAGGGYIPLDPAYPVQRLTLMLKAADVSVLITEQKSTLSSLADTLQIVHLDTLEFADSGPSCENPPLTTTEDRLFYIIYTSGSTGQPKGVAVYQRGFAHLLSWFTTEFALTSRDRILVISSLSFDLTQKNLFAPLLVGAQLHLLDAANHDVAALVQTVEQHHITLLNCTPSAFYLVMDYTTKLQSPQPTSLRCVCLGGEAILEQKIREWLKATRLPLEVVNTYGPTECTDISTFYRMQDTMDADKLTVPIGKPVANTRVYILDEAQQFLPVGAIGELYVAGAGVGMGYVNDVCLTASRFLPDPFSDRPGERMYRTGDLARYLAGGTIEFLGRNDRQVKLRGFRIDPAEIEVTLMQYEKLDASIVMVKEDKSGAQRLIAFVVSRQNPPPTDYELRDYLRERLPEFMLPSAFVVLPALPLTPNGKIDHQALSSINPPLHPLKDNFVAPRNEEERTILQIWAELLNLDAQEIGVYDNFFSLGGHSLLATQVIFRLFNTYNVSLSLMTLFQAPTIADLAIAILEEKLAQEDAERVAQLLAEVDGTAQRGS